MTDIRKVVVKIQGMVLTFFSIFTMLAGPFYPKLPPFEPGPEIPPEVYQGDVVSFVDEGTSLFGIVIGAQADTTAQSAADILVDYVWRSTDVSLPRTSEASFAKRIVISTTAEDIDGFAPVSAAALDQELGKEGFFIRVGREEVYIVGGYRGVIYGVFEFLEQFLGCRWYAEECVVVPRHTKVELPVGKEIQQTPVFEYRETDWLSPRNPEYCAANRINGNRRYIPEALGGNEGYTGGFCHTFAGMLPVELFWETDREIYAISNSSGERTAEQLCLTNPRTIELMCEKIDSMMAANPNATLISLTQNDGGVYCVCPECKALDEAEGSQSGTMISFVNAVADYTKDKYPNLKLDTFAYYYTRRPPKTIVPLDNVAVRLCSYECCFAHPLTAPDCPRNVEFAQDIIAWSSICKNLYIWDYTTNYSHLNGPFPNFGVLQPNMQFFVEHNVIGVYEEGNYYAFESNGEFADLRSFLLARLMWDPYLDYDAEMNGFLKHYYGNGWQYIREYIDITTEKTGNNGLHTSIGSEMNDRAVLNLKPNEIEYINDLWQSAKNAADNTTHLDRVRCSEISWRYWKANNRFSEYSPVANPFGWYAENKKLYEDFQEFGIRRIRERRLMSDNPALWKIPKLWIP